MPIAQFKTQVSLKNYFREIINIIGVCDSIKLNYPIYYLDFCEVFERHNDYPEKFIGFTDIKINYNPQFKTHLVVYIIKNDGSIDDVSVLKQCITGKPKDKLKIAMRVAIQPQINEFINNNSIRICELCGVNDKIEVDHHSELMPFAKLYENFMSINSLEIPTLFDNTEGHLKCFKTIDNIFKENWVKYHKENAILRLLCKKCNTTQPKYKKYNLDE